jgi:hypothetical protein
MTEPEWWESTDLLEMLNFLRGKASDRKFRLFQVACCRRAWSHLPDELCREAVLFAERYADGNGTDRQRRAMQKPVAHFADTNNLTEINARDAAFRANLKTMMRGSAALLGAADVVGHAANRTGERGSAAYRAAYQAEMKAEASLIRCIFGNPFHPITLALACLTPTVVSLAQAAYDERLLPGGELDAHRLAVLADALEEAGCTERAVLDHLRASGPHVRGCFAVDLALPQGR